jgi:IMP cyclohydrolase
VDLQAEATANFRRHLQANSYPGRGLVLGRSTDGAAWLQLYWIMGRSPNSQNRVFVAHGGELRTAAADPSKVEDPSLIIYEAMLELPGVYLVSNGDQTRTVHDALATGGTFEEALATREREPDAPNYTPRISAMLDLRAVTPALALHIIRANPADPALSDHASFRIAPPPDGYGLCLTTYQSDGKPLPPFAGPPLLLPLAGDAETVLTSYWKALDADNRVSLALKRIPLAGGEGSIAIRNRFDAVE